MGREGEDMSEASAGALTVVQGCSQVHTSASAALIHRHRKATSWQVSSERNGASPWPALFFCCPEEKKMNLKFMKDGFNPSVRLMESCYYNKQF